MPFSALLLEQSDGTAGTAETLALMERLARAGSSALPVRSLAVALTQHLPQKDYAAEARALHAYVRDRIRYVRDINGVETLHDPETLLKIGAGDCDDKSILLASLLLSIGHTVRFRAVGRSSRGCSHVLVDVKISGRWLPLETTEPVAAGWTPAGVKLTMNGTQMSGAAGLGGFKIKKLVKKAVKVTKQVKKATTPKFIRAAEKKLTPIARAVAPIAASMIPVVGAVAAPVVAVGIKVEQAHTGALKMKSAMKKAAAAEAAFFSPEAPAPVLPRSQTTFGPAPAALPFAKGKAPRRRLFWWKRPGGGVSGLGLGLDWSDAAAQVFQTLPQTALNMYQTKLAAKYSRPSAAPAAPAPAPAPATSPAGSGMTPLLVGGAVAVGLGAALFLIRRRRSRR